MILSVPRILLAADLIGVIISQQFQMQEVKENISALPITLKIMRHLKKKP